MILFCPSSILWMSEWWFNAGNLCPLTSCCWSCATELINEPRMSCPPYPFIVYAGRDGIWFFKPGRSPPKWSERRAARLKGSASSYFRNAEYRGNHAGRSSWTLSHVFSQLTKRGDCVGWGEAGVRWVVVWVGLAVKWGKTLNVSVHNRYCTVCTNTRNAEAPCYGALRAFLAL